MAVADPDQGLIPFFVSRGAAGRTEIQTFFGRSFLRPFTIWVFPTRAALAAHWREVWRAPELDEGCWAIAAARETEVTLLSPSAWAVDACGHDRTDTVHVRLILTHELVHVLHAQRNPSLGRAAHAMPWFVEGLAVLVSGQLSREYERQVRQLVASGYAPTRLAQIWEDTFRYGLAGSVVGYLESLAGRPALAELLTATGEAEVLGKGGMGEGELLAGWRASLLGSATRQAR